ncbi:CLIP-associated protein [Selaginella moellendorffii]|uniref:CLIP-associated protein n=1 Tax=Selaginella moellendorffii TaxID=88036 RepID=UPI000D1CA66E|nr:CLIP-associated protein [Selaginella moellendorffii]|eukprot:XP_002985873.2 CLIP-associated protein [Selaginella moellendorffii]
MEEALTQVQAKDTKERMAGVEMLQTLLEQRRKGLSASEVGSIVDATRGLLTDNNFRVCQGALQVLASASALAGEHLKVHFNVLVPAIVECLGDAKQPVRDAANRLILALMEISSPTIIVERAGSTAWTHRNWRVREEFMRTMASAVSLFSAKEITLQRFILPSALQLLSDPNSAVREASMLCLEEMHRQVGSQFRDELQRQPIQPAQMTEIISKLERMDSKSRPFESLARQGGADNNKPMTSPSGSFKRQSPRGKPAPLDVPSYSGEVDSPEQPVDPIKVYSERELVREMEKICSTLTQDQDWSVRMAALQRVEGLVYGGATDFQSFPSLLKQLTPPLNVQLSDRRSSIVKQACHLLNILSRELLSDFEACAESFIPMLFKLVVITVQVIAESADNCIKTILRNCRVSRMLPRIVDIAKNDRSGVLRARCCEYALLILEQWPDTPEIQRSAELYEDLIKCCVVDAMSEVRSTARSCYRLFAKTWPERSQKLFFSFDPAIQRLINDEERGFHKRYSSPASRTRGNPLRASLTVVSKSTPVTPQTVPIIAMDRRASFSSGGAHSRTSEQERSLESILQASQQRVNAIETMLRGVDISDVKGPLSKATAKASPKAVDLPSSRDPPFPASASSAVGGSTTVSSAYTGDLYGTAPGALLSPQRMLSDTKRGMVYNGLSQDSDRVNARVSVMDRFNWSSSSLMTESREGKRTPRGDNQGGVPGFQRPLLRNSSSGRSPSATRSHGDTMQGSYEAFSSNGSTIQLHEVLGEGLSPNADWSARVGAFTFIRDLLQNGIKGLQEITQSFEKIMKLFFAHLDDPHHKVAQAALTTLNELVPVCRKPFESYLERILPHVFSRLVDPKEIIRQLSASVLETVGTTYTIESLLPALLRSLDEQRSLKAKVAIIEFANNALSKLTLSGEIPGGSGLMRLWLAKIAPLVNDKNPKLKDIAVNSLIAVYTHYDSGAVLNFILNLSIEEQASLRRALKQYTPRIEVDLVAVLQSKHQRGKKSGNDQNDYSTMSVDGGGRAYSTLMRSQPPGSYSSGSINSDSGRKWSSMQADSVQYNARMNGQSKENDASAISSNNFRSVSSIEDVSQFKKAGLRSSGDKLDRMSQTRRLSTEDLRNMVDSIEHNKTDETSLEKRQQKNEADEAYKQFFSQESSKVPLAEEVKPSEANGSSFDDLPSIPSLLIQMSNVEDSSKRSGALEDFLAIFRKADASSWSQYFNQILTAVLEALDDPNNAIRELALSVIFEMLNNQRAMMEEPTELLVEKLLHASKDQTPKVAAGADACLTVVLKEFDAYRCLSVVVPLLVNEDVRTLITCISCLTKLVSRLPQQELMEQLPSFLPALFDAFGNQNADVRKTVVFCLVDIYIALGKAFVPYLSSLSSNQLRLVTIYANRIAQARTGTPVEQQQQQQQAAAATPTQ